MGAEIALEASGIARRKRDRLHPRGRCGRRQWSHFKPLRIAHRIAVVALQLLTGKAQVVIVELRRSVRAGRIQPHERDAGDRRPLLRLRKRTEKGQYRQREDVDESFPHVWPLYWIVLVGVKSATVRSIGLSR